MSRRCQGDGVIDTIYSFYLHKKIRLGYSTMTNSPPIFLTFISILPYTSAAKYQFESDKQIIEGGSSIVQTMEDE